MVYFYSFTPIFRSRGLHRVSGPQRARGPAPGHHLQEAPPGGGGGEGGQVRELPHGEHEQSGEWWQIFRDLHITLLICDNLSVI